MKRISIIILTLFVSLCAAAQPSQRQKMIHMAAVRIAEQIEVPEQSREAFITLYQKYKGESSEIVRARPQEGENPEKTAELKILDDFEKSQRILALRKEYYFKFREILTPTVIQKMYNLERVSKDSLSR